MSEYKKECPFCHSDLRGPEITEESLRKGYYGQWDGVEKRYYSRLIGIEYQDGYDGVSEWCCPDCGARWSRWTGERLADGEKAQRL